MRRGALELLAHYKTDFDLIKEHRIRMETLGIALYDKDECERQWLALTSAKNIAKQTYPKTSPQLDPYRLLAGQNALPQFGTGKSPLETVISQIG